MIHRIPAETDFYFWDDYEFVVLDLVSGGQTVVERSWLYATNAISGDWLALMNETNAEAIGLELTSNIDLVNLATGERKTIAKDCRVDGNGGSLFIDNGLVIWQEFKPGGFSTRIEAYDIAAKNRKTLIENFSRESDEFERRLTD